MNQGNHKADVFLARTLSLRSRTALRCLEDVIFDFENGINNPGLDDLRGALLLAQQAAEHDAEQVRHELEGTP